MSSLPYMYVWFDFMSIPQVGARGTAADIADRVNLSQSEQKAAQILTNAVESIPAYIERTSLLLVIVPVCTHLDRREACSFATWRCRGWCRLELQAALFKCGMLQTIVCVSLEAAPFGCLQSLVRNR